VRAQRLPFAGGCGFEFTIRTVRFDNVVVVDDGAHVASAYNITFGNGDAVQTVSGIEVFRVVNGKITETWNSSSQPGAWG
jgi:predicted SnoaL-like aldol condensation-catalyzing enzyme